LYLYVAIERTSKFAFVQLVEKANTVTARAFLDALVAAVPYKIRSSSPTMASSSPICQRTGQARRRCGAATPSAAAWEADDGPGGA
jgi:transposase-like protein